MCVCVCVDMTTRIIQRSAAGWDSIHSYLRSSQQTEPHPCKLRGYLSCLINEDVCEVPLGESGEQE